ncbi:peptidase T [Pelomyxa schiedti]|nr:peptidase T [Pelomyxa schiedti]
MSADTVLDRFLRYVRVDTQSAHDATTFPSTMRQFDLARILVDELIHLGVTDAAVDQFCIVTGTIPSNCSSTHSIGLIAHVDVSPDAPGSGVKPIVQEVVATGKPIQLPGDPSVVIPWEQLERYKGDKIISSDGTTLLGADDKAGVAIIMDAIQNIMQVEPTRPRPKIRVIFTPDEEVGGGTDHIDIAKLGVEYAYTVDGGEIGELEIENFNAYKAIFECTGVQVHPGMSFQKMANAAIIVSEFVTLLPAEKRPETTKDMDGFIHLCNLEGDAGKSKATFILREFTMDGMKKLMALMDAAAQFLRIRYPRATIPPITYTQQYTNMRSVIDAHPAVVDRAAEAMRQAGITPKVTQIRGGTDGARLCEMGLPCPNLFAGGVNFHAKSEFVPLSALTKGSEVIRNLCFLWASN